METPTTNDAKLWNLSRIMVFSHPQCIRSIGKVTLCSIPSIGDQQHSNSTTAFTREQFHPVLFFQAF